MKLRCRICGQGNTHPQSIVDFDPDAPCGAPQLRDHLQQHRWQILRLIQGTEGDGTFARFLESLLFEVSDIPVSFDVSFFHVQGELFDSARRPDAVNSDLKGAPRPQKGTLLDELNAKEDVPQGA